LNLLKFLFVFILINANVFAQVVVKDALEKVKTVVCPADKNPVYKTVAEEFDNLLAQNPKLVAEQNISESQQNGIFFISVFNEKFTNSLRKYGYQLSEDKDWGFIRIDDKGNGELLASKPHLLYGLFYKLKDEWMNENVEEFVKGKLITVKFKWLRGDDGFMGTRRRFSRNYIPEATIKELARMGCSHVNVNALSVPFPLEVGPHGEIYYRFYVSSPDFDQFTETILNKGTFPPEYLYANMKFLKEQSRLAYKYGITPGMYICNPRSVPERLLAKYPYLRGARVDHPFRAYRPRYTLTLGHPVVRWHYAKLLKNILSEIPYLGFIDTWLNDSGSGFEHTMRLYPGRNGGPYIVREWNTNKAFAEAAAKNVIRYYKVLRDASSEINPKFRIIAGFRAIPEEEDIIIEGMNNRIDLQVSLADTENPEEWAKKKALRDRGSFLHSSISLTDNYILGVPFPWLAQERLEKIYNSGIDKVKVYISPPSLAPYDINRHILKSFQFDSDNNTDIVIKEQAQKWVGSANSDKLVEIWKLSEKAFRFCPDVPLYSHFGFEWYRLWVRPLVPNIDKIPEKDREYYEKYLMATFNNPNRIDLAADCLWELISVEQADMIVNEFDKNVWEPLNKSIELSENMIFSLLGDDPASDVFLDIHDRLVGLKCYYRTLRNTAKWIAGVHGYLKSDDENIKKERLEQVRKMIEDEIKNMKELINLWENSSVDFIPIYNYGETWFQYGENLGTLLKKKIELMEKYKNDIPYIDPNFTWRMPPGFDVKMEEYLKY